MLIISKNITFLIPKDNRLLIEIIKDEIMYLKVDLMGYESYQDYVEDDDTNNVDEVKIIEEDIIIFEDIIRKIKNAFGLDFLPKLTNCEIDNLAGAIEQKVTSFEFQELYNKTEIDKKLKEKVIQLHDKILPYYLESNNIAELDMFED